MPTSVALKSRPMDHYKDNDNLIKLAVSYKIPSYSLESQLGDCFRLVFVRDFTHFNMGINVLNIVLLSIGLHNVGWDYAFLFSNDLYRYFHNILETWTSKTEADTPSNVQKMHENWFLRKKAKENRQIFNEHGMTVLTPNFIFSMIFHRTRWANYTT